MDLVWQTMCEELFLTSVLYSLRVHAFVLMTNHFHLIASTPAANIDRCMWYFMGQTSQRLVRSGNRINQTYGGRHFKCVLNSYSYYLNAYKYLYRNPVNAELCTKVEEYKYSSLRGLLGFDRVEFPVYDDLAVDVEKTLPWLNKAPLLQKTEAVRAALRPTLQG